MSVVFGNPAGMLALAAVPVILGIHFLQQASKRQEISTLFLLPEREPVRRGGLRFSSLRNTPVLWLQLLCALLVTWLLSEPRWIRSDSQQTVVVVVDSSQSMRVFRDEAIEQLLSRLSELSKTVASTQYILMEGNLNRSALYSGTSLSEAERELRRWEPGSGGSALRGAVDFGRTLARSSGKLIVVTDRVINLPVGVDLLAVGRAVPNVGFSGLRIAQKDGKNRWEAMLRNYSQGAQEGEWWLELGGSTSKRRPYKLAPNGVQQIGGIWPQDVKQMLIAKDADAFVLDDRLALQLPVRKVMRVFAGDSGIAPKTVSRLLTAANLALHPDGPEGADLLLVRGGAEDCSSPCVAFNGTDRNRSLSTAPIVSERNPLVEGLNWNALLAPPAAKGKTAGRQVLVWQGHVPLVLLRRTPHPVLEFRFDPNRSNLFSLPAFVVLLHRFTESVRAAVPLRDTRAEGINIELNQTLRVFAPLPADSVRVETVGGQTVQRQPVFGSTAIVHAPSEPGFFRVLQGDRVLVEGAAHFADTREADFQMSGSERRFSEDRELILARSSVRDSLTAVWIVALGTLCLFCWRLGMRRVA